MNKFHLIIASSAIANIISFSCSANAENLSADANSRFVYIGTEFGISQPVKKSFRHKTSSTDISIKKSTMATARLGYSFYPKMAVEFSATAQPKYNLGYVLPEQKLAGGITVAKTPGKTKVRSNVYMINILYDFQDYKGYTPFFIAGAGIAQVRVKPTSTSVTLGRLGSKEVFRVNKTITNRVAWQVGLGIGKELTPNFRLEAAAKLQVIHNAKIKYSTLNLATKQFVSREPIKKTLGVGEFGIGFIYKLPI